MNLANCSRLPRTWESGTWYRLITARHLPTALGSIHTRSVITRFSPGRLIPPPSQFAILYFADDPIVAQFEIGAVLGGLSPGGYVPHPRAAVFVTLNVQIKLQSIVDLTDTSSAETLLGASAQELTGDWKGYQERDAKTPVSAPQGIAPTQMLGEALFQEGIEGFVSLSAKVPTHRTLMVFPQNLRSPSSLKFYDPSGALVHSVP